MKPASIEIQRWLSPFSPLVTLVLGYCTAHALFCTGLSQAQANHVGLRLSLVACGRLQNLPDTSLKYGAHKTAQGKHESKGGASGSQEVNLVGSTGQNAVQFTPDGKHLAAYAKDLRIWDVSSGKMTHNWKFKYGVALAAFSPDGKTVACYSSSERCVRFFDLKTKKEVAKSGDHTYGLTSMAYSADGKHLACGTVDRGGVYIWDVQPGKVTLRGRTDPDLTKPESFYDVGFTPSGQYVVALSHKYELCFWDVLTLTERKRLKRYFPFHPGSGPTGTGLRAGWPVNLYAFSKDRQFLASFYLFSRLSIWDFNVNDQTKPARLHKLAKRIDALLFAADSKSLFLRCNREIIQWQLATHKTLRKYEVPGNTRAFLSINISPDGKLLAAVTTDDKVHIWRTVTGEVVRFKDEKLKKH